MKNLVVYFSASGNTKEVAKKIGEVTKGDLFEILPESLYSEADLDWQNPNSRSSVEMKDKSFRPKISSRCKVDDFNEYDNIFIGFPIWWYVAPTIINTFLEEYDFTNKNIIIFATSGSSGLGNTIKELMPSAPNANFISGKRLEINVTLDKITNWLVSEKVIY